MSPYGGRAFARDVYAGVRIPKPKRTNTAAEPRRELARTITDCFTPTMRRGYVNSPEYAKDRAAMLSEQDVPGFEFGRDCSD